MCKPEELIVLVADSDQSSLKRMCDVLNVIGLELLACARDAAQGLNLASKINERNQEISLIYCNSNLIGLPVPDFISKLTVLNPSSIVITYSECIKPEAHILSLFHNGSVDHIDFNFSFEHNVQHVTNRWLKAAQLQYDYRERYGSRK